ELLADYSSNASQTQAQASTQKSRGPISFLEDIVPENIVNAASVNSNMLQVIFFALFLGIAMIMLPESKTKPFKDFFDSFNEIILKIIDIIMLAAPYGVFALMASLVADSPSLELFKALLWYGLSVLIGLAILVFIFYPTLLYFFTGRNPAKFLRQILPAQLLA